MIERKSVEHSRGDATDDETVVDEEQGNGQYLDSVNTWTKISYADVLIRNIKQSWVISSPNCVPVQT